MKVRLPLVITTLLVFGMAAFAFSTSPTTWFEEGLMQGSPPAEEKLVNKSNWLEPPFNRWAFQNISMIHKVAPVSRGIGPVAVLPRNTLDLDEVVYEDQDGKRHPFREMLEMTYTDAIVILHEGKIVYEKYFNGMSPQSRHILFSTTKSLAGTMAAILVHNGLLDPAQKTTTYIPELEGSAFGDATVRQVMDMTTGIEYSEEYSDMNSEVVSHMIAADYRPFPEGYIGPMTLQTFLPRLKKKGEHGAAFHYVSANTEVLGWLMERATEVSSSKLFSDMIWSKLGAERDGMIIVDRSGFPSWGGGFACTARDFARFGLMIMNNGLVNGQQVVPTEVVEGFRNGGDKKAFALSAEGKKGEPMEGWSYHDQWWVTHNKNGAFTAIGIYGQWCYIDPAAQMVIAKFSSFPSARGRPLDYDTIYAFEAMAEYLKQVVEQ